MEIFKAKRGCALCTNAHYATLMTVYIFILQIEVTTELTHKLDTTTASLALATGKLYFILES